MTNDVKVLITEINGTELEYHEEYPLTAENISFDNTGNGPISDDVQNAIGEVYDIAAPLVVPINLIYNGSLSNNEFIGYSNLIPGDDTPVISPITGNFVGFTFSNNRASADFALEFRKNTTGGGAFFTWSVNNTQTADVTLGSPESFNAGDQIYIKYIDEGNNARDVAIVLKFKS